MEKYCKVDIIGRGAFSTVFKATKRGYQGFFAVKEVQINGCASASYITAQRELSALKELKHPNIIGLHDVWRDSNIVNIVLDYCDQDLKSYLDLCNGKIEQDVVRSFMCDLLQGLAYCHDQNFLHRDLKPQNLLIENNTGAIKIADFGLARAIGSNEQSYSTDVVTLWY